METTYKWCDGCNENQCNQLAHSCLENYININNNNIEIKINDLYLTGNCYMNKNKESFYITIRLYEGTKFYGKIVINNNNNYYYKYNGNQVIMERIIDYFLINIKYIKNIFPV